MKNVLKPKPPRTADVLRETRQEGRSDSKIKNKMSRGGSEKDKPEKEPGKFQLNFNNEQNSLLLFQDFL